MALQGEEIKKKMKKSGTLVHPFVDAVINNPGARGGVWLLAQRLNGRSEAPTPPGSAV